MVYLVALRVLSFGHFVLLAVAIGLEKFGQAANLTGLSSTAMAGVIGLWVSQVVSWLTPAYLLASNAGTSGYTKPIKVLSAVYFFVVLFAIFLTFWVGYGSELALGGGDVALWRASDIAAVVFMSLDFVVVVILVVLTLKTPVATSFDSSREVSPLCVVAMVGQLVCLLVLLGVEYIWQGIILEASLPSEEIVVQVGQFLAFATWTSAGFLLVIRSKEGGLLLQDFVWNLVTIACHMFMVIMQVFIALGPLAGTDAAPAVAVAFGCVYSVILLLLLVLSFKTRADPAQIDRSSDYLYT